MRVLFDTYWWASGPFANQQVAKELLISWTQEFPADDVIAAVRRKHVDLVRPELPESVEVVATRLGPQGLSAILELPLLQRQTRADIVISHNFTPAIGRSAVFIQDLLFETNPEWFTKKELAYFSLMPATMRRAAYVFGSSHSEAERMTRVGKGRAPAIPVGLAMPRGVATAVPEQVDELADLTGFALIVGRLNFRKNLSTALAAALQSGRVSPEFPLVVVGAPFGKGEELPPGAQAAVDAGAIRFTGFVSDAQLAWLYRNTTLFLFPSRGEGFGLPCLEAMAAGAPVIASDIPVFREILGDYATAYADPNSVSEWATKIDAALARPSKPEPIDLAAHGYSWAETVRRMRGAITAAPARDS